MMNSPLKSIINKILSSSSAIFLQSGDKNTQIAHADHVTINNYDNTHNDSPWCEIPEKHKGAFVATNCYTNLLNALDSYDVVFVVGMPGIGKTTASIEAAKVFEAKGYKIRFSKAGNIINATQSLKRDYKEGKVFVILNDFLGQSYEDFKTDNKKEVSAVYDLIKFIKCNKNIKLIVNTREVIYQEAKESYDLESTIETNLEHIFELRFNRELLSVEERTKIFHSHLRRAYDRHFLVKEHYLELLNERNYVKIITHLNFSPRIIDHMTSNTFIKKYEISAYVNEALLLLEKPFKIWEDEYKKLDESDRILLIALFSLSSTDVPMDVLKECYSSMIKNPVSSQTIDHFRDSRNRLAESLVDVAWNTIEKRIGVIDPSLNDFLYGYISEHPSLVKDMYLNLRYYEQIERLMVCGLTKTMLIELINSHKLGELRTFTKKIFINMDFPFAPPAYMYLLKILLIHLDKSDLDSFGIQEGEIEDLVIEIFESQFDSIESNSRLYFAREFANIFVELMKSDNNYNLEELVHNDKYLNVILQSIIHSDEFWSVLDTIKEKYFANDEANFYNWPNIKTQIIEKITREVVSETYEDIKNTIASDMEYNADEIEEFDDYDDIVDYIYDGGTSDTIRDLISDSIYNKLDEYKIDALDIDCFDSDMIMTEEMDIYEMIKDVYNAEIHPKSVEYKKEIQESAESIVSLFEDMSWLKDGGSK